MASDIRIVEGIIDEFVSSSDDELELLRLSKLLTERIKLLRKQIEKIEIRIAKLKASDVEG